MDPLSLEARKSERTCCLLLTMNPFGSTGSHLQNTLKTLDSGKVFSSYGYHYQFQKVRIPEFNWRMLSLGTYFYLILTLHASYNVQFDCFRNFQQVILSLRRFSQV